MPNLIEHVELAQAAGFITAAQKTAELADRAARLAQAYEHYRFVSEEKIKEFQARLKQKTLRGIGGPGHGSVPHLYETYDQLKFTDATQYPEMPPPEAMQQVKHAAERQIFNTFEVAKIESVMEYKDPIVFGRIIGCPDRFYICQWDNDVKIDDLIGQNEG